MLNNRFLSTDILTDAFTFDEHMAGLWPISKDRTADGLDLFVVTGYDEVKQILARPDIFSSRFGSIIMRGEQMEGPARFDPDDVHIGPVMLGSDDPDHRRYRAFFNPIFSPRQVTALNARIEHAINGLVDNVIERGECDFLNEIAVPYPIAVISDLLGFDQERLPDIRRWSDALIQHIGVNEEFDQQRIDAETREFNHFLIAELDARRRSPGDDVLSHALQSEALGFAPLTDDEILIIAREITVAGNESTRNTLVGGLAFLLNDAAMMSRLRAEPNLIPAAVEEMLRLFSAVSGMWRVTTQDTELAGWQIPKGAAVMFRMDAANRDPKQFPEPTRIILDRPNRNAHLTFGHGLHYCLGNMLARRELVVAFTNLLTRLDDIRIDTARSDLSSDYHILLRSLKALHISFHPINPLRAESTYGL